MLTGCIFESSKYHEDENIIGSMLKLSVNTSASIIQAIYSIAQSVAKLAAPFPAM